MRHCPEFLTFNDNLLAFVLDLPSELSFFPLDRIIRGRILLQAARLNRHLEIGGTECGEKKIEQKFDTVEKATNICQKLPEVVPFPLHHLHLRLYFKVELEEKLFSWLCDPVVVVDCQEFELLSLWLKRVPQRIMHLEFVSLQVDPLDTVFQAVLAQGVQRFVQVIGLS